MDGFGMVVCFTGGATNFFLVACNLGKLVGLGDLIAVTFGCEFTTTVEEPGGD